MRIDDIDALLATVQFSSLNQAAEYLGITQSAITRRLQRLEQTLGVTLLERQTRPLTLTAAGHRVYEQCLSIKRETKKLYGLLDPQAEPHGILRLGVPQSVAEIALQPALLALRQQFPQLQPQVTCGWSGLLQKRLRERRAGWHAGNGAGTAGLCRWLCRPVAVFAGYSGDCGEKPAPAGR
ncbi:HTH-type transcriptional regulator gltC [Raoultella planticola]|uniref:HTH-type transcriptional regulator gltC n=1 Tax=Raoultella planticola TaxID=575 RepID=A0A485AJ36_RAOPL|nr:HTH-type transcriptional regulator gltC [Raoultella planticola]